jgi:hypothetical protein
MKLSHGSGLLYLILALLVAVPAVAQGNPSGSLNGRVTVDGEPLPGVTVSAHSEALQGVRTAVTGPNGDYIFPFLPPGEYTFTYELSGFQTVTRTHRISAAQNVRIDVPLRIAGLAEAITVTATAQTVSRGQDATTTVTARELETLPIARTIAAATFMTPGVHNTGPNNQITISGSQSYENLWMVNGVVVNENVRGQSLPLFIEDALQEVTTSTSGISAEYGRFSGGVVNALTKSGGNSFDGSFRTSFTSDKWAAETPLTVSRSDEVNTVHAATLGGPLWTDRLWFFLAGRDTGQAKTSSQTFDTLIPFDSVQEQQRFEGKLTLSAGANHTLVGSYFEIDQSSTNIISFGQVMDTRSLSDRTDPQDLKALSYAGIITPNFFLEGQYSERFFAIAQGSGARSTDIIDGTLMINRVTGRRWWSPTFCAACGPDETRNNENRLAKANYFLSTPSLGTHDIVVGYDEFNDMRFSENYQSGSSFRIFASNSFVRGDEVFPVLDNNGSVIIRWTPIFNPAGETQFKTKSLFINDRWRFSDSLSFNVGVRYDRNDGVDSFGTKVADDDAISPRIGVAYDIRGDGRLSVHASAGRYVTALANNIGDSTSPAGAPAAIDWLYLGDPINVGNPANPVGTANALAAIWAWFNSYCTDTGCGTQSQPNGSVFSIPGATASINGTLKSPHADEYTIGLSSAIGRRGMARIDYVHREFGNFYASRIDMTTGKFETPSGARGDASLIENRENGLERKYDGVNLQAQYRLRDRLNLGGNYTWSQAIGNFVGETGPNGPITASIGVRPEYFDVAWSSPRGYLDIDQRHKARLWATYDILQGSMHTLNMSVMQNFFSGNPYHAAGSVATRNLVTNPGYLTTPATVTYFFNGRGSERTDDITRTDLSVNYGFTLPVFGRGIQLFVQPQVTNVFNEQGVVGTNTAVLTHAVGNTAALNLQPFNPFTDKPVEGVHWAKGANFGKPTAVGHYQAPRTFLVSGGIRF